MEGDLIIDLSPFWLIFGPMLRLPILVSLRLLIMTGETPLSIISLSLLNFRTVFIAALYSFLFESIEEAS
jgi:hypothetical protein